MQKRRNGDKTSHEKKQLRGEVQQADVNYFKSQKYDLAWFNPVGRQKNITEALDQYDWVIVQAPSGTGKTSTVIWKALNLLGHGYRKIIYVKNPTEAGDDMIGYLTGDADQKLQAHFDSVRNTFMDFMSKGKLESDEKNGNIQFKIPNFLLGATLSDSIVILDEAQVYSPNTLKLLMERVDDSCKLIIMGDARQTYSVKKRPDGLTDLVDRVTIIDSVGRQSNEPLLAYIELSTSENQRGAISKRVTELYALN